MSTLTEVAYRTRKIIKFGGGFVVLIIIARVAIGTYSSIWNKLHPPPSPPPTVSFGKLPEISFPKKSTTPNLQYSLETPTGTFPKFPDRTDVYFMPYQRPNLLALDRAKAEALGLGFKSEPEPLTEKTYQWRNTLDGLILKMDIFNGSFTYSYDWQADMNLLNEKNLPGREQTKQEAKNFLARAVPMEADLENGLINISYLKYTGGKLVTAMSLSEANFTQIELFRKDVQGIPVLTPDPAKGIVSMLISGSNISQKRYINVEYNYYPVKYDSSATYPLRDINTAWNELKQGQSFISKWAGIGNQVIIRRVYLAYFESLEPQSFLQPIYVFEGDNFLGFVPAVSSSWILSSAN